ncbi:MAG: type IX secretion system protein PorQ [Bacteroidales bacterium]|nr:type IX secretion system protein PorQ [Bacteroidales bacterium]
MIRFLLPVIFTFNLCFVQAQSGGDNVFDFLNLTNSARVAALGGQQVSIYDNDLNMVFHNPSLLNGSMSNSIVLNYVNYIYDVNYGYVSYARTVDRYGNFGAGIHYIDYGSFREADIYGERYGTFNARDYSFNLYYSRPILDSLFNVGGTIKAIQSKIETYNSFGLAIDAGITYHNEDRLFTAALVIKNLGVQLNTYSESSGNEPLPFEIQLGITQKLKYAPFRISILGQHLETGNLRYESELSEEDEIDPATGETKKEDKLGNFADNVMRHIVIGLEFVPTKSFNIRLGYNYKRRQELKIVDKTGFTGFSWGVGIRIYKFHISYGRASYHLAAVSNHFSLAVNLSELGKKF